jgi:aminopeptidase 2
VGLHLIWIIATTDVGSQNSDRVLYEPHRIQRIAEEATKDNTIVSLVDRTGLISDATALAKANLAPTSSALVLIDGFRWEKSCRDLEVVL